MSKLVNSDACPRPTTGGGLGLPDLGRQATDEVRAPVLRLHGEVPAGGRGRAGGRDAESAQKLGQLQPFILIAVLPQECMGRPASCGPT
jgi:hypothetical protein